MYTGELKWRVESFGDVGMVERYVRDVASEDGVFCGGCQDFVELKRFFRLVNEGVPVHLFQFSGGLMGRFWEVHLEKSSQ